MIIVTKKVTLEISGDDVRCFGLLCKTTLDDARTRLTREQESAARAFAARALVNKDIWDT